MDIVKVRDHMQRVAIDAAHKVIIPALTRKMDVGVNDDGIKRDESIKADKLAATYINDKLRERFPNCSLVGEESDHEIKGDYGFIVDPLDGTGNASGKRKHLSTYYGVSIAFFEREEMKAGVVYFPKRNKLFTDAQALDGRLLSHGSGCKTVSGANYTHLLSDVEVKRVEDRITTFDTCLKQFDWQHTPKYCAAYESLQPLNSSDPSFMHWSATILYAWDIAATSLINQKSGNRVLNMETGRDLDVIADFGIWGLGEKYKNPIGAITGNTQAVDIMKRNLERVPLGDAPLDPAYGAPR